MRQALYKQGLRHQTIWRGCKVRSSTCFLRRLICFHDEGSPKRRNVELTFTLSTRAPYACTTPQARTRGHLSSSWESKDIKEASSSLPTPCLNVEAFTSPLSFVPASSLPAHLFDHALREPPSRNLPACPHPLHHHYHRRSSPPPPSSSSRCRHSLPTPPSGNAADPAFSSPSSPPSSLPIGFGIYSPSRTRLSSQANKEENDAAATAAAAVATATTLPTSVLLPAGCYGSCPCPLLCSTHRMPGIWNM